MFDRQGRDVRAETGLLDLIFQLAGRSGRGVAGQVRLWSAIVLVPMGLLAIVSGYFVLAANAMPTLSAAKIEAGYNPRLFYRGRRGQTYRESYHITGHLSEVDTSVFSNGDVPWRCTPLVSDPESRPRVTFIATEKSYRRARAENHCAGELYRATERPYMLGGSTIPCDVPADGYLLVDDGSWRAWKETARSLLIMAAVIGSIAAIALLWSLRKQAEDDTATTAARATDE